MERPLKKPKYMSVDVKGFLGDNNVAAMSCEELGAYWRLLLLSWQEEPAASLPPDEGLLARMCQLSTARWRACRERILCCFTLGRDGRWYQERLGEAYNLALSTLEKRSKAGKASAEAKKTLNTCSTSVSTEGGRCPITLTLTSSEGIEGLGERETGPPGFELTAEGLAQAWCFNLSRRRHRQPADDPVDKAREFAELLRLGFDPELLLSEIKRADRFKGEQLFQFTDRLLKAKSSAPAEKVTHEDLVRKTLEQRKEWERANGIAS